MAHMSVLSVASAAQADRKTLPDGTYVEALTPCELSLNVVDGVLKGITVKVADESVKVVELLSNKALHTPVDFVTTIWDEEKQQEKLLVRFANPSGTSVATTRTFAIMDGPITSDEEFYGNVLNLFYPGLEEVRRAVGAKDYKAAQKAYVKYLKTRQTPVWSFDWRDFDKASSRVAGYDTSAADKVVDNLLSSCSVPYQYGKHIDWAINPTKPYYMEWTWQLSRHPFWRTLGQAYWATGDEKYAKAFVRQLRGWIIDNPLPDNAANIDYSRWRTIETGIRSAGVWPESFFRFLGSPSFDDESIVMMVKSFYEHGVHLENFPSGGGNWLTMEMNGLYHIAVIFPEFMASPRWEKISAEKLYAEQKIQFLGDGAQIELAPGYHGVSVSNMFSVVPFARLNGKKLPGGYIENFQQMYEYYMNICFPDGKTPAVNDSGWGDCRSWLQKGYDNFPDRKDFLYVATEGKEGTEPAYKSLWMPWAGWYEMRSGWDSKALHAHFDVGPFSGWHSHEDALSLLLSAYGDRLLSECGTYAYDTSVWRAYAISARGHNVVRVDGKDQEWRKAGDGKSFENEEPMGNRWITNDKFDFGEGWYRTGYGPEIDQTVSQYRALLYLKDRCWLMFDMFLPTDNAKHTYETSFHLNEAEAEVKPGLQAVVGTHEGVANLAIVPLNSKGLDVNIVCGQETPEVQGWIHDERCGAYGCRPVATPIYKRQAAGQWVEPYLLYPVKAGEEFPVESVKAKGAGRYIVTFKDGTRITVNLTPGAESLGTLSYSIKGGKGAPVSARVL